MTSTSEPPTDELPPASASAPEQETKRTERIKTGWRRRMQRMAESRFALTFMCLLSFTDACCSPVLPEVLYVPMVLMRPQKRWFYAFCCSLASVLGGIAGYWLGFWLWENGLREFAYEYIPGFTAESYEQISASYGENAFLWVWMGGFTPLPYKIFTVFAGVCHDKVSFAVFLLASVLSRFPRIYATVWLLDRLGKPAFDALMKRSSTVVLIVLVVAAVAIAWWQFR